MQEVQAPSGGVLMETLRDMDDGVMAICGGMCSCATCHVYVDEAWVGSSYPGNGGTPTPANRHEAERATISQGVVESNHTGFSGSGFVNGDNVAGSYTEFSVNAATAGPVAVTIRYANGTTTNRPADVSVNGTVVSAGRSFGGTGTWDTWASQTFTVNLAAGTNRIRLTATTAGGNPNFDYLDVG